MDWQHVMLEFIQKREAESILIQIMCKEKEFSIFIFMTQHFLCHRNVNGQYTIVLLFEFSLLLSHPIQYLNFFCPPCRGRIAYKHMLKRNSKQVLVLLNSMFISHYDEHGRPGVIASTFITPFVCADT